jgi:hypothetical protein
VLIIEVQEIESARDILRGHGWRLLTHQEMMTL